MKYAAVFIFVTGAILVYNNYNTNTVERFALAKIKESTVLGDQTVMRKDNTISELLRIDANYAFVNNNFAKQQNVLKNWQSPPN
ncbi:MAG: hypothetical protein IPO92_18110 [Saprospiraceae bacterium]|nr:hypothetical protein [Saprospiraceae bacterium]